MNKLSIIIPVFNEKNTILKTLKKIEDVDLDIKKEIIIIDDGSFDGTVEKLKNLDAGKYKIVFKEKNEGKGSALKEGFLKAAGDVVIIQDADLEYDPTDYKLLLKPIIEGRADIVFGSRFRGEEQRVLYFWHYIGNKFLTLFSNVFTNLNLSDMETGYKVFKKEVVDSFKHKLKSERFGIEPELVARVARGGWRIYELPINYYGRTYKEGKKIGWRDGIKAIFAILYFNIFD